MLIESEWEKSCREEGARMEVWVDEELRAQRNSKIEGSKGAGAAAGDHHLIGQARSVSLRSQRKVVSFWDDKENVDPRGAFHGRSASRSPIPSWYPRLPLQDITALVNAFQVMQVDGGKQVSKPQIVLCCSETAPGASSGAIRSNFNKQRNGMHTQPASNFAPKKSAALRNNFR